MTNIYVHLKTYELEVELQQAPQIMLYDYKKNPTLSEFFPCKGKSPSHYRKVN